MRQHLFVYYSCLANAFFGLYNNDANASGIRILPSCAAFLWWNEVFLSKKDVVSTSQRSATVSLTRITVCSLVEHRNFAVERAL